MKHIKLFSTVLIIGLAFASHVFAAAPNGTNLSAAETYTEDVTLNLIDIVASDADGGTLLATLTLSNIAAGTLTTATAGATTSTFSSGVWTANGPIADVNTLLAGVSFIPAANFNASFFINTRVDDGSASANGSKSFTGTAVNDAPVLDASRTPTFGTIVENAGAPVGAVGTQVVSLVDFAIPAGGLDNVTDTDSSPSTGIAITATDSSLTCYYSINSGSTWSPIGSISNTSARLLSASVTNRVYCRAGTGTFGTFSSAITFRAWDQTTGVNGSTADTSTNGGTSAFSLTTDTAGLTIISAGNHAPVAGDDEYTVDQNSPGVALAVRGNDTDPDNDAVTITDVSTPDQGGSAQNILLGTEIGYTPATGFCGDEEFTYEINDGNGETDEATVTIHVVNCDTVTQAPTLISPATGATYYHNALLPITFTLPETLLHDSLRLIFTSSLETSFVLNLRDAAPGTNTFNIDPRGNINLLTEVLSTTSNSIPVETYTVTISYQDVFGNVAASATSTNVTIADPVVVAPAVSTGTTGGSSVSNQIKNLIEMGNIAKAEELKKQFPNAATISSKLNANTACSLGMISRTLRSGSKGEDVRTLQKFLNCKGFIISTSGAGSIGKEGDIVGPATVKAVKMLQKSFGLKADGIFGAKTREAISK